MLAALLVVLAIVVLLGTAWKYGVRFAIGSAALVSLLAPTWLRVDVVGLPIDAKTCAAIVCLLLVCFNRQACFRHGLLPYGFVAADYALIALAIVQTLSDWLALDSPLVAPLRAYGQWLVPYFLGRFCVLDTNDLRKLAPVAIAVCTLLSLCAVVEGLAGINLFELAVGPRPVVLAHRGIELERLGIKRAFGPTEHAIFLGVLLLFFSPWHALQWLDARATFRRVGQIANVFAWGLAMCFTGSRAVIGALAMTAAAGLFAMTPRIRWFVGGGILCVAMVLFVYSAQLVEYSMRVTHESSSTQTIVIDGIRRDYNGAMNRIYIFELYRPALLQTGLFGFGTARTTGFPFNVPVGRGNEPALDRMPTIENAYFVMVLRSGWLGLAAFCAAIGTFVWSSFQAFRDLHAQAERGFAALQMAVFLATILILATVWMPHDFGFMLLWSAGIASSLGALVQARKRTAVSPPPAKKTKPVTISWDAV
jgi:hypothetical protein